jgi:hypothetical protein
MDWNGTIVVEMGFILDSNTSLNGLLQFCKQTHPLF